MNAPTLFIDPPSPFAPAQEWRQHLADLEKIKDPTPDVLEAIKSAEEHLKSAS